MSEKVHVPSVQSLRKILLNVDHPPSQQAQLAVCRQLAAILLRDSSVKSAHPPVAAYPPSGTADDRRMSSVTFTAEDESVNGVGISLRAVTSVQNLLALLLSRLGQFGLLCEMYERSAKFAYGDFFVWFQFALALFCNRRYARALSVVRQCLFSPTDVEKPLKVKYLLAAQTCVEQLGLYDDGVKLAEKALKIAQKIPDDLSVNRAYLLIGSGLGLKAQGCVVHEERRRLNAEALLAYQGAGAADPRDHAADFFSALQSAVVGRFDEAARLCRSALRKSADLPAAVMLLALVLTTDGQHAEALRLVEQALDDYPSNYGLLVLRLKLEMKLQRASGALLTAKDLLLFWRLPSSTSPDRVTTLTSVEGATIGGAQDTSSSAGILSGVGGSVPSAAEPSTLSSATVATNFGGGDSASTATIAGSAGIDLTDNESLFGSVKPLTEYGGAASTISDSLGFATSNVSRDTLTQYRMQTNIWLELAELFLISDDYLEEVKECVEEACLTFPNSHQVLYLKGRLLQKACRWREAKSCYAASLALAPNHWPSLRRAAECSERDGHWGVAEHSLRQLVAAEPCNDLEAWRSLGRLLAKTQRFHEAAQCARTAMQLDESAPLMPFAVVPRLMNL